MISVRSISNDIIYTVELQFNHQDMKDLIQCYDNLGVSVSSAKHWDSCLALLGRLTEGLNQ